MEKDILDVEEAMEFLKTSKPTFYRWLKSGKIQGFKAGKQWRFYKKDLVAFLESTGTDFVMIRNEFREAINFFAQRLKGKGINLDREMVMMNSTEKKELVEKLFTTMIQDAESCRASDIHMEPSKEGSLKLKYRQDGLLQDIHVIDPGIAENLVTYVKELAGLALEGEGIPQRGRFSLPERQLEAGIKLSMKLGVLPTLYGERITLSVDPFSKMETAIREGFEALGFKKKDLPVIQEIFDKNRGLVIITGTPGSGRTTTCYSSLHYISRRASEKVNIMSMEENIAYVTDSFTQVRVDQEKEGKGFKETLQAVMWQDPDVIFVSAIPDRETARLISEIALGGHLVIAQMDSSDIIHAIARLRALGIDPSLLAATLEGAIAQRLVRCICADCREEYTPSRDISDRYFLKLYQEWLGNRDSTLENDLSQQENRSFSPVHQASLFRGKGCEKCGGSGYRERTVLYELLNVDTSIKDLIRVETEPDRLRDALIESNLVTLREEALFYALSGITTLEEALRVSFV